LLQLDGCPQGLIWKYDHTELITDSIVHAAGLGFALVGATALLLSCPLAPNLRTASIVIYAVGLVAMLGFSAAYNLWPVSPRKWWLRRFDHSAIFIFIAAITRRSLPSLILTVCGWWQLLVSP
jgi:hemolysin III